MEQENQEGFTIICNKCGSKNVTTSGADGFTAHIFCNDCDNEN